jgi:GT2 family glycosyltransferase
MTMISIVIGTCNRLPLLRKSLDSLVGKVKAEHEIIVVDAGSTDGSVQYLHGLEGRIQLVCDGKTVGQAKSLNRVFKTRKSEYFCWLSDDNVLVPGMIDQAVSIMSENPDIGMLSLKVKDVCGPGAELPYIGGISPFGILNCNQGVIRGRLLADIEYMDEEVRDYGMDIFLTAKVLLSGYKVAYTRKVAICHYRDHDRFPGAIENKEDRHNRLGDAKNLYRERYGPVLCPSWAGGMRMITRKMLWMAAERLLGALQITKPGSRDRIGFNTRDMRNLVLGRFISPFDPWKNRNRSYYLVQQIPLSLLDRPANPFRHLLNSQHIS